MSRNQFFHQFMTSSLDQIAFPRGVSDMDKWEDKSTIWKIGTPIHVKAAMMYNTWIKKYNMTNDHALIHNGDKIKFVYMKEPNPTRCNVMGFTDEFHAKFELDSYVDRDLQYEKAFLNPLQSFSNLVGFDTEKRARLDAFFSDDDVVTTAAVPFAPAAPVKPAKSEKPKVEHIASPKDEYVRPKPVKKLKAKPTLDAFFG